MDVAKSDLIEAKHDSRSERRSEDIRFVTGTGRYIEDLDATNALSLAVLRSNYAHGTIRRLDPSPALGKGVRGVFQAADLAESIGLLPCNITLGPESPLVTPPRFPLAQDRVRYVGEAVAFVIADSGEAAEDALERIDVEIEPLPAAVDPVAAIEPNAPQIWADAPNNLAFRFHRGDAGATRRAFAEAATVVSLDLVNNRIAAAAIETRGAIARWDEKTDRYELTLSGASVHDIRTDLAIALNITPDRIDVATPDVGGGFGMKNVAYPEYVLMLWAAKRFRRPIRWIASRTDDLVGATHGRANVTRAQLALDANGKFLALDVSTVADLGAFLSSHGPVSSTLAPANALGGLYDIPHMSFDVRGAFTNTAPIEAYRGAGKPEVNYIIERLIDVAARRIGRDPLDLRRRNFISAFPFRTAMGVTIDCGDFAIATERAAQLAQYKTFPQRRRAAAKRGRLRGLGVACFLETARGRPNEEAWLRFRDDGIVEIAVGTHSNGQGHETSFVRLVADRLGLPIKSFRFVQGDTRTVPAGGGHGGARSLHLGGEALLLAVEETVRRAKAIAAREMQVDAAAVSYSAGRFSVAAESDISPSVSFADILRSVIAAGSPDALDGYGNNICDAFTFPYGCHIAEVEVDPETGEVALLSYVAVDDFGTLINPLLTEGQVQGGIVQGIGQALCEGITYDAEGQLLTATFMDYTIPRSSHVPDIDIVSSKCRRKPTAWASKAPGRPARLRRRRYS